MRKTTQSVKRGLKIQETDNYNDVNLAALDAHIERPVAGVTRQIYTLIQVNAPCKVTVTERSQKKLAKIVLS